MDRSRPTTYDSLVAAEYLRSMWFCGLKMRMVARFSLGFLIAATSISAAFPQDPVLKTRTKEEREERFNSASRITMNVQVTDAAGNPVSDLRAADFSLYDNRQARRIASFHPIDGAAQNDATEIVILLDAVNTPTEALTEEKDAIFKYLAGSRKPFAFPTAFVLWFNGHLSATPASKDRDEIGRAFVKLTKNVHSNACGTGQNAGGQVVSVSKRAATVDAATCRAVHFKDSVAALDGIAQQQLAGGGRTLLIWIGSGWPAISEAELSQLTAKQQHDYANEYVTVLHDLQAAQVTVYSLGGASDRGARSAGSTNVADSPQADGLPRLAVDEFAQSTGGRAIRKSEDLVADLRACMRDAEWYYCLSFNAPPAQNDAEAHSLEVKVNRPGVQVRTMKSYYANPH